MAGINIIGTTAPVGAGSTGTNTTGALDTTGATLIVVAVTSDQAHTAPTLSDSKSNTWTGLTAKSVAANGRVQLFYCNAPTTDASHTFTAAGTSSFPTLMVTALSGTAASSPFDQENGTAASATTGSITPSQAGEFVICAAVCNTSFSSVNSYFGIINVSPFNGNHYGQMTAVQIQGAAAARSAIFVATGTNPSAVIASFKSATGGGSAGGAYASA